MKLQTLFEPVTIWQIGGYSVVKTAELKKLTKRLYNAEVGFDYVHSHILPGLRQSRDQHMLNAQKVRDELAATNESGASPFSFSWGNEGADLPTRAIELARSMASVKCKNKYPVGVIGAEARAHYLEARRIASGIETEGHDPAEGHGAEHDSPPVEGGDAQ